MSLSAITPPPAEKKGLSFTMLLAIFIGLPIFIFGMAATINFIKFMNSPIVNGQIPVWSLLLLGVIVLIILQRRRTHPYVV